MTWKEAVSDGHRTVETVRWRKKGQRRRQRGRGPWGWEAALGEDPGVSLLAEDLGAGRRLWGRTQAFLSWAPPGMRTSEKHFSPTIQRTRNPTFVKSRYFYWEGPLRCPSFPLVFCPHSKEPGTARTRQHCGAIQRVNSARTKTGICCSSPV